jgi:hypothetical protein
MITPTMSVQAPAMDQAPLDRVALEFGKREGELPARQVWSRG